MTIDTMPSLPLRCVHTFQDGARHFAFNGDSLLLAEVSPDLAETLREAARQTVSDPLLARLGARFGPDRASRALMDLAELQQSGFFTPRAPVEKLQALDQDRVSTNLSTPPRPCLLQLAVAGVCNLRCVYCYADQGRFMGPVKAEFMSIDVARHAARLFRFTHHTAVRVALLGGEPMLHPAIAELLGVLNAETEALGKQLIVQLDTNGTQATDEMLQALARFRVLVSVSLDGPEDVQDRQRPFVGQAGSFHTVYGNLRRFVGALGPERVNVNITCTPRSVERVADFRNRVRADLGPVSVKITPSWVPKDHPLAWTAESVEAWGRCSRHMAECEALDKQSAVDETSIRQHPIGNRRVRFAVCAFSTTQLAVSADGEVYPCIPLVGRAEFRMGDVMTGELSRPPRVFEVAAHDSCLQREQCQECWAKYACAGGCPVVSVVAGGEPNRCPEEICGLFRYYTEADLFGYVKLERLVADQIFKMRAC